MEMWLNTAGALDLLRPLLWKIYLILTAQAQLVQPEVN